MHTEYGGHLQKVAFDMALRERRTTMHTGCGVHLRKVAFGMTLLERRNAYWMRIALAESGFWYDAAGAEKCILDADSTCGKWLFV